MNRQNFKAYKETLELLVDEDRFSEAIDFIEAIPQSEWTLEVYVDYARMLNNMGMFNHKITVQERIEWIQRAIEILETHRDDNNPYWNERLGFAYYSMGHTLPNQSLHYYLTALPCFQKWVELSHSDEARELLNECLENLANRYFAQKDYVRGFAILAQRINGWEDYEPRFDRTGIEPPEDADIDDNLADILDSLAEEGNDLLEQGDFKAALTAWQSALYQIPSPKADKAEAVWFEASMGDIFFSQGAFHEAHLLYDRAISNRSGEGLTNPFILMRYGECCFELGKKRLATRFLLKAYMLDGEDVFRSGEENLKYLDFLLDELQKREIARQHPFQGFDLSHFWEDSEYAQKAYTSEPPTEAFIAQIEAELGYKLPASYIYLMQHRNGGIPVNTCFPTETPTCWSDDHVAIDGILGIGSEKNHSLCGPLGSQFMIDEWEYPAIGVAICDTPTAGHDMIFLDYRECGPQGEPQVVHIDQENDYAITYLADNFEEFIRGLVHQRVFDIEEEDEEDHEENNN